MSLVGVVGRPRVGARAGVWVSALGLVLLAIHEIDEVIGRLLDVEHGRAYTPTGLTGLGAVRALASPWAPEHRSIQGWEFLARAPDDRLPAWLAVYALLDLALIALYGLLLWRAAGASPQSCRRRNRRAVAIAVAADVAESVLIATLPHGGAATARAWLLVLASSVKWIALVTATVLLLQAHRRWLRETAWPLARLVARGLYTHRYSLIIVVPLALMGLAHGHDILEQVPDIQRRWIDTDQWSGLWSGAMTAVLVVATLLIGRLRTDDLIRRQDAEPIARPNLTLWYAGAAIVAVAGVIAARVGALRPVAVAVFAGVPAVIAIGSTVLKRLGKHGSPPPVEAPDGERVRTAWLVGDVLPVTLAAIAGAGLVRSVTGVVALDPGVWFGWIALAAGVALALGSWPIYVRLLDRIENVRGESAPTEGRLGSLLCYLARLLHPGQGDEGNPWVAPVVLAAAVGGYVAVGLFPDAFARLGVLAAFQIALGSLAIAVAAAVTINRRSGVPYLLWPLRVRVVPITVLALVTAIVCAGLPGPEVHPIQAVDDSGPVDRAAIGAAFDAWLTATAGCDVEIDGLRVRPMLLYAAEGGGIRAAYWTAAAVDAVTAGTSGSNCGHAFVSSGASGGAVGLTVASVATPGAATDQVRAIADQSALSAAVLGLVARDQMFAGVGIGLPLAGDSTWIDRAGLIERSWTGSIEELSTPFFRTPAEPTPVGALVLNSSASNGCRALLSQLELGWTSAPGECDGAGVPVAASIDVHACTGQITAATAALLSARFPYVTPAGATTCGNRELKLVDGGYAENTGIVTQIDLAHQWLPLVRAHNRAAGAAGPVVVPILVYLDNGTGSDVRRDPGSPPAEVLVPPVTKGAATATLNSPESNLQRAEAMFAPEQVGLDDETAELVRGWRPHATAVVYAASAPSVAAPLGWVLSANAMDGLDDAIAERPPALPGHASLGDVLRMLSAG